MVDLHCSNGPVSSMPGSTHHKVPKGTMCDNHPDRKATVRMQGETDSFGCEYTIMCDECYAKVKAETTTVDTSGACEWCGKHAAKRRETRDYDEGMCGRIYLVCTPCINRVNDEAQAELEDMGLLWDDLY